MDIIDFGVMEGIKDDLLFELPLKLIRKVHEWATAA